MLVGDTGRSGGILHVRNVDLDELFATVFDRTDANDRRERNDRTAGHRPLEIFCVVFRKGRDFLLKQLQLEARARFKAFEPFADIGEESGLGKFAIGDDIDAALDLLAHHIGHGLAQGFLERRRVIRLSAVFCLHNVEEMMRPRQAANVGRLYAIGILLKLHGAFFPGGAMMRRSAAVFFVKTPRPIFRRLCYAKLLMRAREAPEVCIDG